MTTFFFQCCPIILVDLAYEITIRNTKPRSINLTMEDQLPISNQKSIEIELLEDSNAKYDSKTGKLDWQIKMEPNSTQRLNFKYMAKYPY